MQLFFNCQIFALKNMILSESRDFSWKKNDPNSPDFEGKKNPNCQILMINQALFQIPISYI